MTNRSIPKEASEEMSANITKFYTQGISTTHENAEEIEIKGVDEPIWDNGLDWEAPEEEITMLDTFDAGSAECATWATATIPGTWDYEIRYAGTDVDGTFQYTCWVWPATDEDALDIGITTVIFTSRHALVQFLCAFD